MQLEDTGEQFTVQPQLAAEMQLLTDNAAANVQPLLTTESSNQSKGSEDSTALFTLQPEMAAEK